MDKLKEKLFSIAKEVPVYAKNAWEHFITFKKSDRIIIVFVLAVCMIVFLA